jgi:porphobilinogen synthase
MTVPIDASTSAGRWTTRAAFPTTRMRRLRSSPALRRMVAESRLGVDDLVAPLFVADGLEEPRPVSSMPGVVQHTVESLAVEVKRLCTLGVPGVILFGLPRSEDKDPTGSAALRVGGITQRALATVRDTVGDQLVVMADCCLDEFTDHGHCGVIDPITGDVENDATLRL